MQKRDQDIKVIDLDIAIDGNKAILRAWFYYVMRWSDEDTWGVDFQPQDGDLVHVP